jgi:tryptophan-rich sensory protein
LAALAVALIGGTLTDLGPWYTALRKPPWQPPGWAFPVVWTTIYALCALAGAGAWRAARENTTREWMIGLFALNGFLNILWSFLFFRLHRPDWALFEVVPFWLSILALFAFLVRITRPGAWLLAPYLLWVAVAALLNFEVVRLNGPFA